MHRQQVRIAGNNHVGSAIQRHFQKPVIFRVAAFATIWMMGTNSALALNCERKRARSGITLT
jgi:hypothetical protein